MSEQNHPPPARLIELRKDIRYIAPKGALASLRLHIEPVPQLSPFEGDASLLDLSVSGCKIQTDQPLSSTHSYEMILYLPTFARPILIAKAVIQWVFADRFGVKFLELHEDHDSFLHDAVGTLPISHTRSR